MSTISWNINSNIIKYPWGDFMNQLELSEIIDKVVNKSDLTTKDIPSLWPSSRQ